VSVRNFSQDGKRALALVQNDRTPGAFYLFDDEKGTVEMLAARAPWIDANLMSEVKAITYAARDGLQIPGYLTLPHGKAPKSLPLIVFPHGGPYAVRDVGRFDRDAQFLASRGYAVLQMNFRGSGGYGTKFREAGNREWGGKMQDDVTDAVKWAVSEGIADANRVCIFGASYGGYAALMGAATTPELYRCAISYAGVSDLETMFQSRIIGRQGGRDRTPEELDFMRRVVGDKRDAAWLRERSPVTNAARIRCPVFIAHASVISSCRSPMPRRCGRRWSASTRPSNSSAARTRHTASSRRRTSSHCSRASTRFSKNTIHRTDGARKRCTAAAGGPVAAHPHMCVATAAQARVHPRRYKGSDACKKWACITLPHSTARP